MNRTKQINRCILLSFALIFLSIFSILGIMVVYAEGTGDGTGGGQGVPLRLESSSPQDGSMGISLNTNITLNFNKNVINCAVKENNTQCISLIDQAGAPVNIHIIMGDDQINPDLKRIITVDPDNQLNPGETYKLKINKNLTAKNGMALENNVTVTFTTEGKSKEVVNLKEDSETDSNDDTISAKNHKDTQNADQKPMVESSGRETTRFDLYARQYLGIALIVIALIGFFILFRTSSKHKGKP